MAVEWVTVGMDVGVGGIAGVGDQFIQNQDDNREAAAGAKLPILKRYGTYYNYGVPLLAIFGTAFGFLKGDMATRLVTAGAQLAGRKVTHQMTHKAVASAVTSWSQWRRDPAAEARARAAAEEEARRVAPGGGSRLEF